MRQAVTARAAIGRAWDTVSGLPRGIRFHDLRHHGESTRAAIDAVMRARVEDLRDSVAQ